MKNLTHFNNAHNNQATVDVRGNIAYFNLLGLPGIGSDRFNDRRVAVRLSISDDEVSGQTLDDHQLVGVRRWRFTVEDRPSGFLVTVQTEAYERTRGNLNRIGAWWAGEPAQMQIWTAYLQNISDYYKQRYNAGRIFMTDESEYLGDQLNPWRSGN